MEIVLRQEKKYMLNYAEYKNYSNKFEALLHGDPHNDCDGYIVRSLYFDTLDNKDFFLKEMGVEIRRKVRLRIYDVNDVEGMADGLKGFLQEDIKFDSEYIRNHVIEKFGTKAFKKKFNNVFKCVISDK